MRIGKERVASQMHAFALMREYDEGNLMTVRLFREGKEYETEMLLREKYLNSFGFIVHSFVYLFISKLFL